MADLSGSLPRLRVVLDGVPPGYVFDPATTDPTQDHRRPKPLVRELAPTLAERSVGRRRFAVLVDGWHFEAEVESAESAELRERARRVGAAHRAHDRLEVRAQIPGRVVAVRVSPGESVELGHPLLAIEAMKMENEVRAPRAGTIARVSVVAGALVELGDELVVLE